MHWSSLPVRGAAGDPGGGAEPRHSPVTNPRAAQKRRVLAGFHPEHVKPNTAKQRWGRIKSVLKQTNKNAFSKARLKDLI